MDITTALLADAASVSEGKLYVHGGGWDVIHAAKFPATHPTLALVFILRVGYEEAQETIPIRIDLIDQEAAPVTPPMEAVINIELVPSSMRDRSALIPQAVRFDMLSFEKPGSYSFGISTRGEGLSLVEFYLAQL